MRVLHESDLTQIARQRDELEVELACKLQDQCRGGALQPVIELCRYLVRKLLVNSEDASVESTIIKNTWLRVWSRLGLSPGRGTVGKELNKLEEKSALWSPEDCSDIIRLYGEVVEKVPAFESANLEKERMRGTRPSGRAQIVEDLSFEPAFRSRKKIEATKPPDHVLRNYPDLKATGITGIKLFEEDTVKKIDRMFALPEGASISGTTADSIYSFTLLDNPLLAGWLQLLPIATMVSQYHHTLLECALTLTKNKKIKYQIGFYRSLAPLSGEPPVAITNLLDEYEDKAINRGLVAFAWTIGGRREGLLLEGKDLDLIWKFKDLATASEEHLLSWRYMNYSNNAGTAWDLWDSHVGVSTLSAERRREFEDSGLEQAVQQRYGDTPRKKHSLIS